MLLSLIPLIWLTVIAYVVAVCRLAAEDAHTELTSDRELTTDRVGSFAHAPERTRDAAPFDHSIEQAMCIARTRALTARPHCESRQHAARANLRSSSWRVRTRTPRGRHAA